MGDPYIGSMASLMTRVDLRGKGTDVRDHLPRAHSAGDEPVEAVREIIESVRTGGDAKVLELTARFDGTPPSLVVDPAEVAAAVERIDPQVRASLEFAAANVEAFHQSQLTEDHEFVNDGLRITGTRRPVDRAGCYVPGGRASYPSTVLMTVVPARVAGVPEVVLCSPPGPDGRLPDETLAAAHIAGAHAVYACGGAQAVAAMAYGTESISAVDVIVGPGNVYVAVAKREVAGLVGVPSSFAGPSEIVVVADAGTPVDFAAIDIVVQAEHGPGGQAWLVTWDEAVADAVSERIDAIAAEAVRAEDVRSTLSSGGFVALVDDPAAAIEVANRIAPEHLQLMCDGADGLVGLVRHAGEVFIGPLAPASLGDYVAGPSHVLPTSGTARFAGPLTTEDFSKPLHIVRVDQTAFDRLGPHVAVLADVEGLDCHAQSVRVRGIA